MRDNVKTRDDKQDLTKLDCTQGHNNAVSICKDSGNKIVGQKVYFKLVLLLTMLIAMLFSQLYASEYIADKNHLYTNRLIQENSPYLQQHAHNPVDWYPWGEEAFAKAKKENKLIFLSIGYSTCHWCHVMERESFASEEVAKILNENFVSIKVDREQRPDLDMFYMIAVRLLNSGVGGWPMNSILTPNGDTIIGGSYYSPTDLMSLLNGTAKLWEVDRELIEKSAEKLAKRAKSLVTLENKTAVDGTSLVENAVSELLQEHDPFNGGFGIAPKFPQETKLMLLMLAAQQYSNHDALQALEISLQAMMRGGVYDHVGGGFHRYAIDNEWLIPHFEKMLYNQANLARVYTQAWTLTGNKSYRMVAENILDYLLRDMKSIEGLFYSATDADSGGGEGEFFLWTPQQLRKVLSPNQVKLVTELYGITEQGDFEGSNILHQKLTLQQLSEQQNKSLADLVVQLEEIKTLLYKQREQRDHPYLDKKIILSWNAMTVAAFAEAGVLFENQNYVETAKRTADNLWKQLHNNGNWKRIVFAGKQLEDALQEDYAMFGDALIAIYDATGEDVWMSRAEKITAEMVNKFWDDPAGGFFVGNYKNVSNMPDLARMKYGYDGAIPSGNSVALSLLQKLYARSGNSYYQEKAMKLLEVFSDKINDTPTSYSYMLMSFDKLKNNSSEVLQYGAKGKLKIVTGVVKNNKLTITLKIKPGWHINAAEPLDDTMVATQVKSMSDKVLIKNIKYPKPDIVKLNFSQNKLAIYQGKFDIDLEVSDTGKNNQPFMLQLLFQACSDEVCLLPEEASIWVRKEIIRKVNS